MSEQPEQEKPKEQFFRVVYDRTPLDQAVKVVIEVNMDLAAMMKGGRQMLRGGLMETIDDIMAIVVEKQIRNRSGGLSVPGVQKVPLTIQ